MTVTNLPRFSAANRARLEALVISHVAEQNPHRAGTPTYDAFLPFVGTVGMNLWDLWKSGRNPSHLAYRVNSGVIRVTDTADVTDEPAVTAAVLGC